MSPLLWALLLGVVLLAKAVLDVRRIKRNARNYSEVEAERLARELTAPLGNVTTTERTT